MQADGVAEQGFEQFDEAHTLSGGFLGDETGRGHARERVGLEGEDLAVLAEAEVGTAVTGKAETAMTQRR